MMNAAQDKTLILSVAPNGARKTAADHPRLPVTPDELAYCARQSLRAGAAMIHMHVRDDAGRHSLDVTRYQAATEAVRRAVGQELVIQITTEAVGMYSPAQQIDVVKALRPEAASVALREVLPDASHLPAAAGFFAWMHEHGTVAQYILYDRVDVETYLRLRREGVIAAGRHWVLFVLGRYTPGQVSAPQDLLPFLDAWQQADPQVLLPPWSMCAFGKREAECASAATLLGGHARIGFENNMAMPDGSTAYDNAALLQAVRDPMTRLGYRIGDAQALRAMTA
ncbi:3-keto-5-aminohexanoate cleavage protein [Bordetella trematum]|uniref:3-keto-5-aminohexanoate cleavage protein n=1 Tax=Bordetella trematum TaxID=123899 RepID=UPI001559BD32|nr:3-keto-5-aminohexanoate cleavage protein [Bordetella trematum]